MRFFLCAALSAAVLATATGCGSGDDDSATTTASTASTGAKTTAPATTTTAVPAERKAFLAKVNPICEDYNREVKSLQKDLEAQGAKAAKAGSFKPYAGPLKDAQAAAQRASDRFNDITPPASEAEQAKVIGGALKAQARGNTLLLQAARKDDGTEFTAANEALKQVTPKLQALMRDYGMTVCGAAG